jgi:hypothetical protein
MIEKNPNVEATYLNVDTKHTYKNGFGFFVGQDNTASAGIEFQKSTP